MAHSRVDYEPFSVKPYRGYPRNGHIKEDDVMRPVVIEMKNGKPIVVSCPKKVQVVIREPKKKGFKKQLRTGLYHIKTFLDIQ